MAETLSTATMIERLSGMLDTRDLTSREQDFVRTLLSMKEKGRVTALSEPQVNWLNDLHRKHFS